MHVDSYDSFDPKTAKCDLKKYREPIIIESPPRTKSHFTLFTFILSIPNLQKPAIPLPFVEARFVEVIFVGWKPSLKPSWPKKFPTPHWFVWFQGGFYHPRLPGATETNVRSQPSEPTRKTPEGEKSSYTLSCRILTFHLKWSSSKHYLGTNPRSRRSYKKTSPPRTSASTNRPRSRPQFWGIFLGGDQKLGGYHVFCQIFLGETKGSPSRTPSDPKLSSEEGFSAMGKSWSKLFCFHTTAKSQQKIHQTSNNYPWAPPVVSQHHQRTFRGSSGRQLGIKPGASRKTMEQRYMSRKLMHSGWKNDAWNTKFRLYFWNCPFSAGICEFSGWKVTWKKSQSWKKVRVVLVTPDFQDKPKNRRRKKTSGHEPASWKWDRITLKNPI